ncbi:hypothetical protein C3L33_13127, partial [Rhododendron williamsianum]
MGEFLEIDMPVSGHREGRLMRILVSIDITVPVRRGMKLKIDVGQPFWVEFRYEKLPMFCCYCGFIGHEQKSCIKQTKDMENGIFVMDSQYGNWLRASPGKSAGWKKYGPGGNQWSPGKSGNSKPDYHGGNRGVGPYRNPDMVKRLGAGDLNSVYSRAQIGDTGEDGMLPYSPSTSGFPKSSNPCQPNPELCLLRRGGRRTLRRNKLSSYFISCSKDSIPTQKKRGRPLGSKSKTDRSKGETISGSGSASSTDVLSSTTPAPRVGEKRPSSMGETRSSDLDGTEVCSPAKRPRVTGGVLADVDSIMDDPISTETVEDASRDWPQRGK